MEFAEKGSFKGPTSGGLWGHTGGFTKGAGETVSHFGGKLYFSVFVSTPRGVLEEKKGEGSRGVKCVARVGSKNGLGGVTENKVISTGEARLYTTRGDKTL